MSLAEELLADLEDGLEEEEDEELAEMIEARTDNGQGQGQEVPMEIDGGNGPSASGSKRNYIINSIFMIGHLRCEGTSE